MIRTDKVIGKIYEKQLNKSKVASMLGITPKTFSIKLKKGVLNSDEIGKLIEILCIEDPVDIFFAHDVTQNAPNEKEILWPNYRFLRMNSSEKSEPPFKTANRGSSPPMSAKPWTSRTTEKQPTVWTMMKRG